MAEGESKPLEALTDYNDYSIVTVQWSPEEGRLIYNIGCADEYAVVEMLSRVIEALRDRMVPARSWDEPDDDEEVAE